MATSSVTFKGEWIIINDGVLHVIAMLAREFAESNGVSVDLVKLVTSWEKAATFAPPGMIELDLSGSWEEFERTVRLIEFLKTLRVHVRGYGNSIPGELLMKLLRRAEDEPSGTWYGDIRVDAIDEGLARLAGLLSKSVDGKQSPA